MGIVTIVVKSISPSITHVHQIHQLCNVLGRNTLIEPLEGRFHTMGLVYHAVLKAHTAFCRLTIPGDGRVMTGESEHLCGPFLPTSHCP